MSDIGVVGGCRLALLQSVSSDCLLIKPSSATRGGGKSGGDGKLFLLATSVIDGVVGSVDDSRSEDEADLERVCISKVSIDDRNPTVVPAACSAVGAVADWLEEELITG